MTDILEKPALQEARTPQRRTVAELSFDVEGRMAHYAEQPITFEEFLELSEPHSRDIELINGQV